LERPKTIAVITEVGSHPRKWYRGSVCIVSALPQLKVFKNFLMYYTQRIEPDSQIASEFMKKVYLCYSDFSGLYDGGNGKAHFRDPPPPPTYTHTYSNVEYISLQSVCSICV